MVKERNRFDALAEELFEEPKLTKTEEPTLKRSEKDEAFFTIQDDAGVVNVSITTDEPRSQPPIVKRQGRPKKPPEDNKIYLSVNGAMYPARSLTIRTKEEDRFEKEYVFPTARRGGQYEISFKLPGTALRLVEDNLDAILVVTRSGKFEESDFYRLDVRTCNYTVDSRNSYTEVHANAWRMT